MQECHNTIIQIIKLGHIPTRIKNTIETKSLYITKQYGTMDSNKRLRFTIVQ